MDGIAFVTDAIKPLSHKPNRIRIFTRFSARETRGNTTSEGWLTQALSSVVPCFCCAVIVLLSCRVIVIKTHRNKKIKNKKKNGLSIVAGIISQLSCFCGIFPLETDANDDRR